MKKMLLIAVASTFLFACSRENNTTVPPNQGIVFELSTVNQLQSSGSTRTRPLYGQDAIQEVEQVNVYVFQKQGANYVYNKTYTIPAWSKGSTFQRFTVPDNDKLTEGDYQFLAVGREATDNYTLPTPVVGTTQPADMSASVTAPGQESEIFAGNSTVSVTSEGVRVNVEMTRKIAGVLGYFKNVPANINGQTTKYLRVTINSTNNSVLLFNGSGTGTANTSYNVLDVDLSGQTVTSEGVYAGNDLSAQGVAKVSNSQLFGKFILPVNSVTMTVGLYDASNNLLKSWSVQDEGQATFNLAANHFYALGRKVSKNDTTGGGTPDPGDDDAPIDLLKDQVIAVTINANWNTVHNLFIQ